MSIHILKSWPQFFAQIVDSDRTHELRRNDRGFLLGDLMELHEYDPKTDHYTGRVCTVKITSITSATTPCAVSDVALHQDFCILSVKLLEK